MDEKVADEEERAKVPSKCAVCDTYDMKSMWKCSSCDAMNVSKNASCWKCKAKRTDSRSTI
ncbi:MAG TPA: hypothetical protein VMB46_10165 [Methanomassiliicoccales archaeon]|nr:hypothetical protein [Methanomassiliicoccales archaeon]